jgi:flagellar basal body-associated protein FliL
VNDGVYLVGNSAFAVLQNAQNNPGGTLLLAVMLLVVLLVIAGVGVACWVLWHGRRKRPQQTPESNAKVIVGRRL